MWCQLHLGVKVLMVMGHEGCGAVKAARSPLDAIDREPESLRHLLKSVKAGLDETRLAQVHDKRACDREAVVSNVKVQVEALMMNDVVQRQVEKKELLICGAFYDMSSGIVDFFLSAEEPGCGVCTDMRAPGSPLRRTLTIDTPRTRALRMAAAEMKPPDLVLGAGGAGAAT
jgi:hypothetical protein